MSMSDPYASVTGRLEFANTIERPGMLHARVLRSPLPHARIRAVDVGRALKVAGVHAILTGDDLRRLSGVRSHFGPIVHDQPVVAIDKVRYVGEPVAAVAADDVDVADQAVDLIAVDYEELPSVFDAEAALDPAAPRLHEEPRSVAPVSDVVVDPHGGSNACSHFRLRKGDVERGLLESDLVVEDTFTSPPVQHVPLETHGCVAEAVQGRLTVWTGSQIPFGLRRQLAEIFGLPLAAVRVIVPTLGGGYGGKGHPTIEPLVTVLSYLAGRPVCLQLRREEEFVTCTKHGASIRLVTGVKRDGTIVARKARCLLNTGAFADVGPRVARNAGYGVAGPYRIPNVWVDSYAVYTNLPSAGAFRGFGVTEAAWAYESQIDMIADRLGIDPLEIRRKNLLVEGDELATGQPMHDCHFRELIEDVTTAIGWDGGRGGRPATHPSAGGASGRRVRGKGLACAVKGTVTPSTSSALVKLDQDGSLTVLTGSVEMGQGLRRTLALLAGGELGIPADRVTVPHVDTDTSPYDQQTSSSRSTYAMGHAVRQAARLIREEVLKEAGEQLEVHPEDLELVDGMVRPVGAAVRARPIGQIVRGSGRGNFLAQGGYQSHGGLDPETGRGVASVHWHQAAGAAEVEVDLDTGRVTVLRLLSSVFAGRVVNRVGAELQSEGNLAFGLGQALFEQLVFDSGQLQNGNLGDYMVASILDMPSHAAVSFLEDPGGAIHGVGESALPTVMPAIANAVSRATGVRVRDLPITPERLVLGLQELEGAR
jgi:CO/xanthine dehydrogenase Mo-binding subunit